jgi:hypothetical protein
MSTSTLTNDRPWPKVRWDYAELGYVAAAVRLMNPHVTYDSDEDAASYVRSASERSLYRAGDDAKYGYLYGTGGFIVTFTGDGKGGYNAHPAVTGYTAKRYAETVKYLISINY